MHILKLNEEIRRQDDLKSMPYHMRHIRMVKDYAVMMNRKLGEPVQRHKLGLAALAHDLLKEHDRERDLSIEGMFIPGDNKKYLEDNMNILQEYGLQSYAQEPRLHAFAAGVFLHKEYHIEDPAIVFPVLFHSCPIISVYQTLSSEVRTAVDIIMLADKLSSNWLKINFSDKKVRCDLDKMVFGPSRKEFNYELGLYVARLIAMDDEEEEQSDIATAHYYHRLKETNPLIKRKKIQKSLGDKQKWPEKRASTLHV